MDDELETLVVRVRGDTAGFARDVETMRAQLEGPLAAGANRAARSMEGALERFVRTGKFGFDDLKRTAVSALDGIAARQLRAATGSGAAGGLLGALIGAAGTLIGLPGRATGGPVTGGRGYLVGERGPEVFVPQGAGRVEPMGSARGPVSITVNVAAPREASGEFMRKTGAQVARSVRAAMVRAE